MTRQGRRARRIMKGLIMARGGAASGRSANSSDARVQWLPRPDGEEERGRGLELWALAVQHGKTSAVGGSGTE